MQTPLSQSIRGFCVSRACALSVLLLSMNSGACSPDDDASVTPTQVAEIVSTDTVPPEDVRAEEDTPIERLLPHELPTTLSGGFIDLSASIELTPPFGVGDDDVASGERAQVTAGMFVDLDGDGLDEVVLSVIPRDESAANRAYRLAPEGLTAMAAEALPAGTTVLAEDLDGDGHPDLLNLSHRGDGPLFWGDGAGGWSGPELIGGRTLPASERVAVSLADLDHDGWLDLLVEGYCQLVPFFRSGTRTYLPRPHLLQGVPTPSAYAVMNVELDALGSTLLALGNVTCDGPQESVFGVLEENSQGYPLYTPISLHDGEGSWSRGTESHDGMQSLTYQSPMGVAAGDLNGDGLIDLVLPLDPIHAVLLGQAEGALKDVSQDTGLALLYDDWGAPMLAWGSAMLDLDRDGRLDLVMAHGDDGSRFEEPPEDAPPMFATAHLNRGDLSFVDATEALGLGRRGRWRALAVGDPDRDGDPDLVIGGVGELPRVYRNAIETPHKGFSLRLRGSVSNHLGVGALIEVEGPGLVTQRHYVGGVASPNVVSAPVVFIGLGGATGPVTTRVHWPSGIVQEVVDLPSGTRHVLEEPGRLALYPAGRHLPADGVSTFKVDLSPPDPSSTVEVEIEQGLGTLEPAYLRWDGTWSAGLIAPTTPGTARLRILIDGVPLRVRPRVWFDAP
jgi:hypothetical protein